MIWLINTTILNIAQLKWSLLTQSQVHMLTLIRKIMKEVPDLKLAFMWHYQNTKIFLQSAISKVDLKILLWLKKLKILCWGHTLLVILTLFRMGFFGAAQGWGGRQKANLHTYPTMMILGSYTLPKKDMNHVTHPLSPADISNFSPEISKFCYIKKYMYRLHFDTKLLILFTFPGFIKIFLTKNVAILVMSAKIATRGLLKDFVRIWPEKPLFLRGVLGSSSIIWDWH